MQDDSQRLAQAGARLRKDTGGASWRIRYSLICDTKKQRKEFYFEQVKAEFQSSYTLIK